MEKQIPDLNVLIAVLRRNRMLFAIACLFAGAAMMTGCHRGWWPGHHRHKGDHHGEIDRPAEYRTAQDAVYP